jgi:hypothetical protein
MVGRVRVEAPLDDARRERQGAPAGTRLDGLEIEPVELARAYERAELGRDLRLEGAAEPPLSPPSAPAGPSSASAQRSQAPQ